jgi:hypothetical protein
MSQLKNGQRSVRIVLPDAVYNRLKRECPDHGDLSKLVRRLIIKYLISITDLPPSTEEDLG